MNHKQEKLENPARLADLNPPATLRKLGLGLHDTVCDIGAGTGIFTIPAARLTKGTVYAIDMNDELLLVLEAKSRSEGLDHIKTIRSMEFDYDIPTHSVDMVLLVTVLHEIEEKPELLREINRLLKPSGKLCVIEFRKEPTPMGPPLPHRIAIEEVESVCTAHGFTEQESFLLGENFYVIVFNPKAGD